MQYLLEKELFPHVNRPGRYIGGEMGQIKKDHSGRFKVALGYPDMYEVGMSYLGLRILYNIINADDRFVCERFFAPDVDAAEMMAEKKIPSFTLESHVSLKDFDLVGFTLAYEMVFSNVLSILDLAGIPLEAKDRADSDPLIAGGGPISHNPEPMSRFFDFFYIGDAEEQIIKIIEILNDTKDRPRIERLRKLVENVESIYVPQFYDDIDKSPLYDFAPPTIKSARIKGLKNDYYNAKPIVPFIETVHDRLTIEIMRGCPRGCRFCQAGTIYKPVRCRPMNDIVGQVNEQLAMTGFDEVSLLSLSSSDYPDIIPLTIKLSRELKEKNIALSLPSLRPGTFSQELADAVKTTRKTGLTFAPEAGTNRLREVVRKDISESDLFDTLELVFKNGWNLIKLYYMIGLPTETDADLDGIIDMAYRAAKLARSFKGKNNIKISASPFSPKAHTPFQWDEQAGRDEISRKNDYLRRKLRSSNVTLNLRNPNLSYLEGIIGRGDREIGEVILKAYQLGARFDGWTEQFDFDLWVNAFAECGLDPENYLKGRSFSDRLPWSHIELNKSVDQMIKERQKASEVTEESTAESGVPLTKKSNLGNDEMFGRGPKKTIIKDQSPVPTRSRIRVKWARTGLARFLSHLDNARVFERAFRRCGIPIEFSQGFHPHMKLSFGPPLQLGYTSEAEYFDMTLDRAFTPEMGEALDSALPDGYKIIEARPSFTGKKVSISGKLNRAVYEVEIDSNFECEELIAKTLSRESVEIERRGKNGAKIIEVRQAIYALEQRRVEERNYIYMELGVGQSGYIKPTEALAEIGLGDLIDIEKLVMHRKDFLYIDDEGNRLTPMEF